VAWASCANPMKWRNRIAQGFSAWIGPANEFALKGRPNLRLAVDEFFNRF